MPYPADYDEAMRRFMGTRLHEGDSGAWLATRAELEAQGLDATSVRRAEADLVALRAESEIFLARLISAGGLTADELLALGADHATVARIDMPESLRPDLSDGDASISL